MSFSTGLWKLTSSCAYYWGITGGLIGLTLYRPAYGAKALKGTLLDNPKWIGFWTAFIIVSCSTPLHQLTSRSTSSST